MKVIKGSKPESVMHKYDYINKSDCVSKPKLSKMFFNLASDLYIVGIKIKGFHWNVIGEGFFPIHVELDNQVKELLCFADGAAELVRQIDKKPAPISMAEMIKASSISEEVERELITTEELLPLVVDDYKAIIKTCHHINMMTDKANRQDLSDFVIRVRQFLDKYIWQFESHVEE